MMGVWENIVVFIEKVAADCASELCTDTCLVYFKKILKDRKKQTSLDRFLLKHPAHESEESMRKRQKSVKEKIKNKKI